MNPEEKIRQLETRVEELTRKINDLSNPATLSEEFMRALVLKGFLRANLSLDYISPSNNSWRTVFVDFLNSNLAFTGVDNAYYIKFTAATSDVCTISGNIEDNTQVYLLSTNTLPSPLSETVPYYIINSTGSTFKLSTSLGGAAVNITDAGTGAHYLFVQ